MEDPWEFESQENEYLVRLYCNLLCTSPKMTNFIFSKVNFKIITRFWQKFRTNNFKMPQKTEKRKIAKFKGKISNSYWTKLINMIFKMNTINTHNTMHSCRQWTFFKCYWAWTRSICTDLSICFCLSNAVGLGSKNFVRWTILQSFWHSRPKIQLLAKGKKSALMFSAL